MQLARQERAVAPGAPLWAAERPDPDNVRRIAVLVLSPIGDTLFATPALRALRQTFRRATIVAVVWTSNRAILSGNPNVDVVLACESTVDLMRLLRSPQWDDFDLAVALSNVGSWFSLLWPRVPKVGFNGRWLHRFYAYSVADYRDIHAVDYCLNVVRAVGADTQDHRLEFPLGAGDRRFAREFLAGMGVRRGEGGPPLVALHPGGRFYPAKRWPVERFASLATRLQEQWGARVLVIGGKDDAPLAQAIAEQARGQVLVTAGRLGLRQSAALLEQADVFIGNDSGPLHLANAVGTPVVGLFGPTDPANFGPRTGPHQLVRHALPCSPCFRWMGGLLQYVPGWRNPGCGFACMRSITVEEVMQAAGRLLQENSGRAAKPEAERARGERMPGESSY